MENQLQNTTPQTNTQENAEQKYIDKAKEISNIISKAESRKVSVTYHTFSEIDENGNVTGNKFVCYLREPNILAAARALDYIYAGKINECGIVMWPACFLAEYSDAIIE